MSGATISEFGLIDRYFKRSARSAALGIGDDAAIIAPAPGMQLLTSTDMLAAGTHFFADTEPESLGWKTLAVNISDLAAMGATPRWALLALALPAVDEDWIAAFARGFFSCADTFGVELIGGDTTRGPMNFCVTILGEAPPGQALLRSGAQAGNDIWISGHPGCAALGLAQLKGKCTLTPPVREECEAALLRPQPRVALGLALRGIASAAIDVSDGLLADLGHILEQSNVSAEIRLGELPPPFAGADMGEALIRDCVLAGGDDYELLFTAPASQRERIGALSHHLQLALARVGSIVPRASESLTIFDSGGNRIAVDNTGYDHFR